MRSRSVQPGAELRAPTARGFALLNLAYLEQHVPALRDWLKRAGVGLAHLLYMTLGNEYRPRRTHVT